MLGEMEKIHKQLKKFMEENLTEEMSESEIQKLIKESSLINGCRKDKVVRFYWSR